MVRLNGTKMPDMVAALDAKARRQAACNRLKKIES